MGYWDSAPGPKPLLCCLLPQLLQICLVGFLLEVSVAACLSLLTRVSSRLLRWVECHHTRSFVLFLVHLRGQDVRNHTVLFWNFYIYFALSAAVSSVHQTREQFHKLQPPANIYQVQHLQWEQRHMLSCLSTTTHCLTVLQMQARLEVHYLQTPLLEPHPQLMIWKGCSHQPQLPHKLPLRVLSHSCGHPQAQHKAGIV